jgi:hypothetical protein
MLTPVDRGCAIGREERDKLGNPFGDGRHDRLNSEPRLRLRNEYASSRVFVAGSWMSFIVRLMPAADVPRGSG